MAERKQDDEQFRMLKISDLNHSATGAAYVFLETGLHPLKDFFLHHLNSTWRARTMHV